MSAASNFIPRTVLVTGAAGGIGFACARGFVVQGHRVVFADLDADATQRAVKGLPASQVLALACDVSDADGVHGLLGAIEARWEPVSILVNNAGISPKHGGRSANLLDMSAQEWRRVLDVNLTAPMQLARATLPFMRQQQWGRIVNIASLAARTTAMVAGCSYMASKAGLLGLTRHIATAYGRDGITANAVAPGRIVSPMTAETAGPLAERYKERNPSGREGTVDEIAAAVLYLASDAAGYTNGACIDVNGGMLMI